MTSQLENLPSHVPTNFQDTYRSQLQTLRELFPDWKEEDFIAVLTELNGDLELTISRISEGYANQWNEVKSKKDSSKPKQPIEKNVRSSVKKPIQEKKNTSDKVVELEKPAEKKNFTNKTASKSESKKFTRKPRDFEERPFVPSSKKFEKKVQKADVIKQEKEKENIDKTNAMTAKLSWSNVVKTEVVVEKKESVKVTPVAAAAVSTESIATKQQSTFATESVASKQETVSSKQQSSFATAVGSPSRSLKPSSESNTKPANVLAEEQPKVLPKPISRRFRNEEAVIVPGESNIVDIGLRFGSLHLDQALNETSNLPSASASNTSSNITLNPIPVLNERQDEKEKFANPRYISSGIQATASPVIGKQEMQPPNFMHGHGMGMPFFDYGNEMQARAYAMGYFNDHGNFPQEAAYSGVRSEPASKNASNETSPQQPPQNYPPMSPMHYAYYPPYFMPGQYPSYQSSYGHGLVNKSMYPPQMYPANAMQGQKQMSPTGYPPYMANQMYVGQPVPPAPGFAASDKQANQADYASYASSAPHSLYGLQSPAPQASSKNERIANPEYHNYSKPNYENYKYPNNNNSYFNPMATQPPFGYSANSLSGQANLNSGPAASTNTNVPNSSNPNYGRHQYWNNQH